MQGTVNDIRDVSTKVYDSDAFKSMLILIFIAASSATRYLKTYGMTTSCMESFLLEPSESLHVRQYHSGDFS